MSARKRMLLLGGTGFIGRNILPSVREDFLVDSPSRGELDLLDEVSVERIVRNGSYDVVVHLANSTPAKNPKDAPERMLADSLRAYFNLRRNADAFGKMMYVGSGAEYDKRRSIVSVSESDIGRHVPLDDYGFAKYVMNEDARRSDNVYNIRIFGCYGPTDAKTKFIRDAIDCCLGNRPITIRQDCMFDYMYVGDLAYVVKAMADAVLRHHDYNVCTGRRVALSEVAAEVARQMGNARPVEIAKPGWNNEYTASNGRFMAEFRDFEFTSLEAGVARQIAWQKGCVK